MNTSMFLILGQQQAEGFAMVGDVLKTLAVIGGIVFVLVVIGAAMNGGFRFPVSPPQFAPYNPPPMPSELLPVAIDPSLQPLQAPSPPGPVNITVDTLNVYYVVNVPPPKPDARRVDQGFIDQQSL